jgi:hypothetical protein
MWNDVANRIYTILADASLTGGPTFKRSSVRIGDEPETRTVDSLAGFVTVTAGAFEDDSGEPPLLGMYRVGESFLVSLSLTLAADHGNYGEAMNAFDLAALAVRAHLGQNDNTGVELGVIVAPSVSRSTPEIENDRISVDLTVSVRRRIT